MQDQDAKIKDINPTLQTSYNIPISDLSTPYIEPLNQSTNQITNKLNLTAATSTSASLNIPAGEVDPTQSFLKDGDIWNKKGTYPDTSTIYYYSNKTIKKLDGVFASGPNLRSAVSSTSETELFRSTFFQDMWKNGGVLEIVSTGIISVAATKTFNLKIYLSKDSQYWNGSSWVTMADITLASTGVITAPVTFTNCLYRIQGTYWEQTISSGGGENYTFFGEAQLQICYNNTWYVYPLLMTNPAGIDTYSPANPPNKDQTFQTTITFNDIASSILDMGYYLKIHN